MDNIFEAAGAERLIQRINQLHEHSERKWGKMNVSQMLIHCAYAFEDNTPKPTKFTLLLIRLFRKKTVVGDKPYRKNMLTARAFSTLDNDVDFAVGKERLINGIKKINALGFAHFDNRKHTVFGKLTGFEWNTFFVKHLDHHLRQFGV